MNTESLQSRFSEITDSTGEILFEVYDAAESAPRFLGLAIVALDEIRQSTTSMHSLPLQSRPFYDDSASGALMVEFGFTDRPSRPSRDNVLDVPEQPVANQPTPSPPIITTTTMTLNTESTVSYVSSDRPPAPGALSVHVDDPMNPMVKSVSQVRHQCLVIAVQYFQDRPITPSSTNTDNPPTVVEVLKAAAANGVDRESPDMDHNHYDDVYTPSEHDDDVHMEMEIVNIQSKQSPLESYFREERSESPEEVTALADVIDNRQQVRKSPPIKEIRVVPTAAPRSVEASRTSPGPLPPPSIGGSQDVQSPSLSTHSIPIMSLSYTDSTSLTQINKEPSATPAEAPLGTMTVDRHSRATSRRQGGGGFFTAIKERMSMRKQEQRRARSVDQMKKNRVETQPAAEQQGTSDRASSLPREVASDHEVDDAQHKKMGAKTDSEMSVLSTMSTRSVYAHSTLIVEIDVKNDAPK